MEQPIAVNTIEITEALFREAVRGPLKAKYNALMKKLVLGLGLLLLILCAVTLLLGGSPAALVGEAVLLCAIVLWVRFSLPRTERKRIWNKMTRSGPPMREIKAYHDCFTVKGNGNMEESFGWDEVVSSRTTEHLLILKLQAGQEVMLDRTGFSLGSEQDILAHITPV